MGTCPTCGAALTAKGTKKMKAADGTEVTAERYTCANNHEVLAVGAEAPETGAPTEPATKPVDPHAPTPTPYK